jgi:hypothetical protein
VCIWSGKSFQIQIGSGFNPYLDFIVTMDEGRQFSQRKGSRPRRNLEDLGGGVSLGLSKYGINDLEMDFNLLSSEVQC